MSVHKFGRRDNDTSPGVSLSYIKRNFVKKEENRKHYITLWAEESGGLVIGKSEWSFGNGAMHRKSGYTMLTDGVILKMGMSIATKGKIPEETGASLLVNGEVLAICNILKPHGKCPHVVDTPHIKLKTGDTINFVSEITTRNVTSAIMSLLIEIEI